MLDIILIRFIVGLGSIMLAWASKYGNGSILLGLSRFINPSYESPEVEAFRIHTATSDLFGHMTRVYGRGWKLTVTYPSSVDSKPCVVVERNVETYVEPEIGYDMNETFWTGEEAADEWVTDTLEDSFKILGDKR